MIDYKKLLNDEQYRVVTEGKGPCLVLAGAGSGKTRTLVFRVAYLVEQGNKAENILLVTFTNKAAKEMLGRVEKLLGFKPEHLWGGTFHHIGNLILRRHANLLGYERNFNILDEEDSESLVKHSMAEIGLNVKGQNFPKASVVRSIISFGRNTNQEVDEVCQTIYDYPDFVAEKMAQISFVYEQKKRAAQVMDFDDLLVNWLKLLHQSKEVKEKYAKQFEYILVDEYQDTNYIQAEIIRELASHHHNVLVVGDDSQSIYSFRAADVKNILNFPKLFPGAKVYKIETNYRSTPPILHLANEIIVNNVEQFHKQLVPWRPGGLLPCLIAARDEQGEAAAVARRIMELYRDGKNYNDFAVLYRATYQAADLQLALSKLQIPYVVRGGLRYFEQAHIKDIIAYLKVLANFQDEIAWKRILNLYEGIGEKKSAAIWQRIQKLGSLTELINAKLVETGRDQSLLTGPALVSWNKILQTFRSLLVLSQNQKGFIADAVEQVLHSGYEDYLKNVYENYRERLDDLGQLINFVAFYHDLNQLLSDVMLSESFAGAHEHDNQVVVLSTIHQAKGLEWPVVFIIGLRDGHFPYYKSMEKPAELEEERRLFYVAVTRAKDELNMLYPVRSFSYKFGEMYAKPSMFIRELDKTKYMTQGYQPFSDENNDEEKIIHVD